MHFGAIFGAHPNEYNRPGTSALSVPMSFQHARSTRAPAPAISPCCPVGGDLCFHHSGNGGDSFRRPGFPDGTLPQRSLRNAHRHRGNGHRLAVHPRHVRRPPTHVAPNESKGSLNGYQPQTNGTADGCLLIHRMQDLKHKGTKITKKTNERPILFFSSFVTFVSGKPFPSFSPEAQ